MKNQKQNRNLVPVFVLLAASVLLTGLAPGDRNAHGTKVPIYLNTSYSFEERAADLVSRLTLEEKQGLLGNNMAAVPRLGIKAYNTWSEALHGVLGFADPSAGIQGPTSFPNSVALGAAWDPELIEREARAISDEARAINATGTKGLTYWSPVVEPIRDPRWGRTGETYGEDPFLVSQIAGGFVRGMVGDDPHYLKTVPCGKHYLANNSEFDRHVSSSDMDSRDLREYYLAPYKKLIEEDRLPSIMSSYNAVNGVPASASLYFLDSIARRTYGLNGYITGDCSAIEDIYTGHYYVETAEEAVASGLVAGVDSDCGRVYQASTIDALNKGLITMADIDKALLNIFTIRMRTGEFDPPAKVPYALYPPVLVNSEANRALAKEIATKTPVLLKNDPSITTGKQALPLIPVDLKTIVLVGPQADEVELGPYSGRPEQDNMVSPLKGIERYIAEHGYSAQVLHSSGGNTVSKSNLLYVASFELYKNDGPESRHDATKYSACSQGITVGSGMGSVEQVRTIDDGSWTAYENIDLANVDSMGIVVNIPTEGGIIEVRVGSPGGNLVATLNATTAAGNRSGGVYGAGSLMKVKVNRLGVTEPQTLYFCYRAPEDVPIDEGTLEMARNADVAVVFVGTDERTATEEADRLSLLLPGNQVELIKAVAAVNPYTIVVMQTLGCVEVEEFRHLQNIPGILWVGYNGQAQGDAMASILFGDVSPGGKLNATWYKSVKDLPPITDYNLRGAGDRNGRTLWYFDKDVSYEFGYGLSYTTFEYGNFRISKNEITPHDRITVSADVENTGNYDGDEVVQIYLSTPESPAASERPIKRLKGFKRVAVPAGQTKRVEVDINCSDLWFWDLEEDRMVFDPGNYVFEIGSSSKDIRGRVSARMNGEFVPELKTVVADCGTVVLDKGASAQTRVTAAMTDDRFHDLNMTEIQFRSNNPEVASIDKNGTIIARGTGIATLTASVTIDGKTVSDGFPVKVMPDLKASLLKVNKKKIKGFSPDREQYSFLMKKPSDKAPVTEAFAADPGIAVEISQAKGVPGTAVVTMVDYITYDKKEYVVSFGTGSESDEFSSPTPGDHWSWTCENKENWSLSKNPGYLVITSAEGDITGSNNNAENILLQSANTDWTIDTRINCSRKPVGFSENAGIVACQDDDNFVKLVYRASFARRGSGQRGGQGEQPGAVELSAEYGGDEKFSLNVSMEDIIGSDNTLLLRLVKSGSEYVALYSTDGESYTELGRTSVVLKDIQAGLIVCNGVLPERMARFRRFMGQEAPAATPFEAAFDYFRISNSGLK